MRPPFDPSYILEVIPMLLPYLALTLLLAVASLFLGSILGLLLTKAKLGRNKFFRGLAHTYTTILRCTPTIVLLFIVFYGLPEFMLSSFGIDINLLHKSIFTIITFSLLYAATSSELMRSSYEAVDKGQFEAAVSVGLSEFQAFRRIVLPQCFVVALPNFATSVVGLLKEAALAYTIGLIDIMGKAQLIVSNNYNALALETYIGLAIIYWTLSLLIQKGVSVVEGRLLKGRKLLKTF